MPTDRHPILDLYDLARERVYSTRGTWNCVTPGCSGDMDVRASSYQPEPDHADDMLKCPTCRATITHGQAVAHPEREVRLRHDVADLRDHDDIRSWRRVDFVRDWPDEDDDAHQSLDERLRYLGYVE